MLRVEITLTDKLKKKKKGERGSSNITVHGLTFTVTPMMYIFIPLSVLQRRKLKSKEIK